MSETDSLKRAALEARIAALADEMDDLPGVVGVIARGAEAVFQFHHWLHGERDRNTSTRDAMEAAAVLLSCVMAGVVTACTVQPSVAIVELAQKTLVEALDLLEAENDDDSEVKPS